MSNRKGPGFVLADLVLPLGIGAVLLSFVWPRQSNAHIASDEIASNERGAITALRSIAFAQAKLVSSGAIDTDDDGLGEHGFFGELMGTAQLRIYNPVADVPDMGDQTLTPPLLPRDFGDIYYEYAHFECVLLRNGYFFKMFLPDVEQFHVIEGIGEDGPVGIGGSAGALLPDPDTGEALWCCYAWPLEDQVTGHRVFFVNQKGQILQTKNDRHPRGGPVYDGFHDVPDFDAAYSDPPTGPGGMGAPLGHPPGRANDGNVWAPIGM